MTGQDDQRIDFASVFPAKGDSRRPPDWWGRGLLYAVIAVFLAYFVWNSWAKIDYIVLDLVISIFIALAIEPMVLIMIRHGWKRGVASAVSLVGLAVIICALFALFGSMFVQQVISMVKGIPALYDQIVALVNQYSSFKMPEIDALGGEIVKNLQTSWVANFAGQAVSTTMGLFSALLDLMTIVMVTYYISAAGPKMRRSMCQWLGDSQQRRFLLAWTIVQDQISGFLFSRSILALINATCTAIFLEIIHVPYWLPLALFCGIVSQFIPTVGTYIGGALPVVFAWGSNGVLYAVGVLVFITVYQQFENLILSPKISQRTMDLNPAIAFLAVLVFGSVFGALGAFLALPITASLQAIFKVYTKRYELVDSPLLYDPDTVKKSKVVEGAEAIGEHVFKPVTDHMPRAAKGSSARVPIDEELRHLTEQVYRMPTSEQLDDSETMAIPKGVLGKWDETRHGGLAGLNGTDDTDGKMADTSDDDTTAAGATGTTDGNADHDAADRTQDATRTPSDDNPRSRWR
ncbi:AI-2E family transporter [Bifidobacterium simiiventris]|uniref:AI-2E family transporter n=1 Tax=Bifidobacterium simiiventris TaxID=2834434 RepID=UPI001C597AFD|nr:AI-2E family transporter [Bifidobacterium simiiventris]MBW3078015.1 AI-2E family transporter [Bifidobacterium simiiventris]